MWIWIGILLYTSIPTPCHDVCEVLDMEYVGEIPCSCFCFDPATKRREEFVSPDCTHG